MAAAPTLVWFRHDLRLTDHPALSVAAGRGPIVPVLIVAAESEPWSPGAASRWWLHHSLVALDTQLRERGLRLIVRRGEPREQLLQLLAETGARGVVWGRRYEPFGREQDTRLKLELRQLGVAAESFNTALLHEPWEVSTQDGRPYQVFTPFSKACLARGDGPAPWAVPESLHGPARWPDTLSIADCEWLPKRSWAAHWSELWRPGEVGAAERLANFLSSGINTYDELRDRPDHDGVSGLSPHLHFGELSPRQVWHAVRQLQQSLPPDKQATLAGFLRQLLWREFAVHLLYHFPRTPEQPLRDKFARFPWRQDSRALRAWQQGRTGYPIVDAGMRQLWLTGGMHNRARMIVGSFLVKDLLISWREGAAWFWQTLVDADLANNTLGWQWIGGCGADAAPYFRIFNPVSQGEKFDPQGAYVRRWVPELHALPAAWIHRPWEAPAEVLSNAGVELGRNYPRPLVDHATARVAALAALRSLGESAAS